MPKIFALRDQLLAVQNSLEELHSVKPHQPRFEQPHQLIVSVLEFEEQHQKQRLVQAEDKALDHAQEEEGAEVVIEVETEVDSRLKLEESALSIPEKEIKISSQGRQNSKALNFLKFKSWCNSLLRMSHLF